MADSSPKPRPFDVPTIKSLIRLMSRHDLSEIDLCEGDQRIRLRRGPRGSAVAAAPMAMPMLSAAPAAAAAPVSATAPAAAAKPTKLLLDVKSPGPGTFYIAASPGAAPYVKLGSRVTPTTVVGMLEAMKLFTDIPADCTGVIAEVLVENQQPVEFDTVLFRVDPAG